MIYEELVTHVEIVDVDASNVDKKGFFCAMSKRKSSGYREKLRWLKARFQEGLTLKMIGRGGRGFIEYMPAELCWRPIEAPGYMAIHCLWVVGRAKNAGCGTALLDACIADAKAHGKFGIVAVTARGRVGLGETDFFLKRGFSLVATDPHGAELVVLKLRDAPNPNFSGNWAKNAARIGDGLRVMYSAQCPFAPDLVENVRAAAAPLGLQVEARQIKTARQLHLECASGYGTFTVAYGGRVIGHLFHKMSAARLAKLIEANT